MSSITTTNPSDHVSQVVVECALVQLHSCLLTMFWLSLLLYLPISLLSKGQPHTLAEEFGYQSSHQTLEMTHIQSCFSFRTLQKVLLGTPSKIPQLAAYIPPCRFLTLGMRFVIIIPYHKLLTTFRWLISSWKSLKALNWFNSWSIVIERLVHSNDSWPLLSRKLSSFNL